MTQLNQFVADPLGNHTNISNPANRFHPAILHPTIRSVPERCYREMHRAEPIRPAAPLRFQAWTQPFADAGQSFLRLVRRPTNELVLIRNRDERND